MKLTGNRENNVITDFLILESPTIEISSMIFSLKTFSISGNGHIAREYTILILQIVI